MMQKYGGIAIDSSINRWAIRLLPMLVKAFIKYKCPVVSSAAMSFADQLYVLAGLIHLLRANRSVTAQTSISERIAWINAACLLNEAEQK